MSVKDQALATIQALKASRSGDPFALPVRQDDRKIATLEPVTWQDVSRPQSIRLLADWRRAAADAYPSQFPVTLPGTERWLIKGVLETADRLLFWVRTCDGARIGHVGLFRLDETGTTIELDNILRGVSETLPGVMLASVQTLLGWTFENLYTMAIFLRVFSDNGRALRLYERCGFEETMRVPLRREQEGEVIRWLEVGGEYRQPVKRYFVTMALPRECWQSSGIRAQAA